MLSLLDDPNQIVFDAVSAALAKEGRAVIPVLHEAMSTRSERFAERAQEIIERLHFAATCTDLIDWVEDGADDLLQGAYLVARSQYPELGLHHVVERITQISSELRPLIESVSRAVDRVHIVSQYLFEVVGLSNHSEMPHMRKNNCINEVLDSKLGNSITLSIIYASVCQQLNLPVKCVCLQKFVILCYVDAEDEVLFYINPSHYGAILGSDDIRTFLDQQNLDFDDSYFEPCTNVDVIRRLLMSLEHSFNVERDVAGVASTKEMLQLVETYSTHRKKL